MSDKRRGVNPGAREGYQFLLVIVVLGMWSDVHDNPSLFIIFLLALVLSVLRFTAFDCSFGIFKLVIVVLELWSNVHDH